jgi:hypothetical protein
MIPRSYSMDCTPSGIVDAFDSSAYFKGACRAITNLIFDQSNRDVVVSRPGVTQLTNFPGFNTPGFVSIQQVIGTRIYGMLRTARNPGHDEPFVYDIPSGLFIAVSGVLLANTPLSPATVGPWTPPTMANVGVFVIITHPGFSGVGTDFFGVIDITNPAAPAWSSQALTTNALTVIPTNVANFNNRAYFSFANKLAYSDTLTLVRTLATQQLTVGDDGKITALSGLPISTTSSGIIGALMIFKENQTWQLTGDTVTSNLTLTFASLTIGTKSPRSLAQSPQALYFASASGPYFIDPFGTVRVLTHTVQDTDPDIQQPFINATEPTRTAASYAGSIYRICIPTRIEPSATRADFWWDEHRRRWHGPHTFPYDCASYNGLDFILSDVAHPGMLIKSQSQGQSGTVYGDLGVPNASTVLTCTFPKTNRMTQKQVVESTQELSASGGSVVYNIDAMDEQGNSLDSIALSITPGGLVWTASPGLPLWGGGGVWSNAFKIPHVYSLPWTKPLVFQKMAIQIMSSPSSNTVQIGTHFARYQDTGYMNLTAPNTP